MAADVSKVNTRLWIIGVRKVSIADPRSWTKYFASLVLIETLYLDFF